MLFSFVFIFSSCENNSDKIEIYLLKNRIRSSEGISITEHDSFIKTPKSLKLFEFVNYDTISGDWIYGGKYEVSKNDLNKTPLIHNDEILSVNLEKSELILTDSGKKKIEKIKPNMKYGVQFTICVNKEPQLVGYFRSNISSYVYNWNYIGYDYYKHDIKVNKEKGFIIYKNESYEKWKPYKSNLLEYPELIKVLKESNRLK